MEQLSPWDWSFLAIESTSAPAHFGWITVLHPGPEGPLTFDAVIRLVSDRLPLVPRLRRRIVPVPLGLGRPYWVEDPEFELGFHVREIAVPAPGRREELADVVAPLHARGLDRSRPLWELYLIQGLEGGLVGLYAKEHFAIIDPVRGTELMTALLDESPGGRRLPPAAAWVPDRAPSGLELLARVGVSRLLQPGWMVAFERRLVDRVRRNVTGNWAYVAETVIEMLQRTPGLAAVAGLLPSPARQPDGEGVLSRPVQRAPRVSFNRPITTHRRVAFTSLPFAQVRVVKEAKGTTVNDVVIAVCAGALRQWLGVRGELPGDPLLALIPVMVRDRGRGGRTGYRVSAMVAPLPTNEPDALRRLEKTHEAMRVAKGRHAAMSATVLQDMSLFAPPAVTALAGRVVGAIPIHDFVSPAYNVVISNAPGPTHPLYCAGARQAASYPMSVINEGVGLHMSFVSNDGQVHAGVVSDREALSALWELVDGLDAALEELGAAIGEVGAEGATRGG